MTYGKTDLCILIEGPSWSDAGFFSQWLASAALMQQSFNQLKQDDGEIAKAIERLEIVEEIDFGISAMDFLHQLGKDQVSFVVELQDSTEIVAACLMANLGLFRACGHRYQVTQPAKISKQQIRTAVMELAATGETDIYPELLLTCMRVPEATSWQARFRRLAHNARIADRKLLLEDC